MLAGMELDEAVTELNRTQDLLIGETMRNQYEEIEEGNVIRTDPKAGRNG